MPSTRGKWTAAPEPPARVISSERFSPNARTPTSTHPARASGVGRSSSCSTSGPPGSCTTTACIAMKLATRPARDEAGAVCDGRGAKRSALSVGQRAIGIRAPSAQEGKQLEPVAALVEVEVGDEHSWLVARCLHEHASVGIADEGGPVEAQRRLLADAVDGDHEHAVGDRVADDHLLPQGLRVELGMVRLGADRRWIHEHVGSLETVCAGELREPLIPAGGKTQMRRCDRQYWERGGVSRPGAKVAILVIAGGDGDVQLARAREQLAVGRDDDRGVVAEPVFGVGALVQRGVYVYTGLARDARSEAVGGAAGELLRLGARCMRPAGVNGEVARKRELLQAHEPCALAGGTSDRRFQRRLVLVRVGVPALLHGGDAERLSLRWAHTRGGVGCGGGDHAYLLHGDDSRLSKMSTTLASTPAADGYRMPGEFEAHCGCWMAWPERPDNWRLGAKPAQRAYAAVAEAISVSEPVTMAVSDAQFEHCRTLLSPSIRVVELSSDDAWMRDIGPTFVVD